MPENIKKPHYLKLDFDRWKSESDDEDVEENPNEAQIVRNISCIKDLKIDQKVSIKSLYNLKKLLQSEMMRYCNEGCFMLISIS